MPVVGFVYNRKKTATAKKEAARYFLFLVVCILLKSIGIVYSSLLG